MNGITIRYGIAEMFMVKLLFLIFYFLLMGRRKSSSGQTKRRGNLKGVDEKLFREAVKMAGRQPRLAFYSPIASCILNYWKSAVPRFSISEFLAQIVERELARAWPQLYNKALKNLKRRRATLQKKVVSKRSKGGGRS
ncbi:MAG: hypothetical protein DRN65_04825 [Thaumarchaeota archaeon]|nr:MAG: hypothetical protein DRN65_04825 [Nitrososphaerota archaeon]